MALQIFYYHPDRCISILRELRSSIVDHIMHFPHLRVKYVAMCYSVHGPIHNQALHITTPPRFEFDSYPLRINDLSGSDTGHLVKGKPIFVPPPDSSTSTSSSSEMPSPYDSDDPVEQPGRVNVIVKGIRLRDISGIKMWEKEIWSMKL